MPDTERFTRVVVILGSKAFAPLGVMDMHLALATAMPCHLARELTQVPRVFLVFPAH